MIRRARTVAPASALLSLAEAKAQLRVTADDEDAGIAAMIDAATDALDLPNGMIGRALVTQTWRITAPAPDAAGRFALPVAPVQSVSAISYLDQAEATQALAVEDFPLQGDDDRAWLQPRRGASWPVTAARPDAISVTAVCGYGEPWQVPASIRQAARMLVAHWYDNRGAVVVGVTTAELEHAVSSLVSLNRVGWVG